MRQVGTAACFKAIHQEAGSGPMLARESFASQMEKEAEAFWKSAVAHSEEETLAFTRWLKSTGITAREVNELTESFMASHYLCTRRGGQTAVPTPDMFDKLIRSPKLREVPMHIRKIVYGR